MVISQNAEPKPVTSPASRRTRRAPVLVAMVCFLVVVGLTALCIGAVNIPLKEVASVLIGKATSAQEESSQFEAIILQLRFPRVLCGLLVGAALSVAGALMQGLFRNPLADPGLIGVSSGAALGAVTIIILGGTLIPGAAWLSDMRMLPAAAFVGALAVTFLIQRLASSSGYTAVATLLLAGIAMNSIVGAVIGLSTFLATDAQLRTLSFWTQGSLGASSWETVAIAFPLCGGLLLVAPFFAPALNAMALGEAEAGHLGFSVERIKTLLIVATAAGVGACVAFTGMIGFVGLIVPHLVRLMLGPDHRWLLPGSAVMGAAILIAADTTARTMVSPAEMPIGILTAALGGPFFLAMLLRQRRKALWG